MLVNKVTLFLAVTTFFLLPTQDAYSKVETSGLIVEVFLKDNYTYFSVTSKITPLCIPKPEVFVSIRVEKKEASEFHDISFFPKIVEYESRFQTLKVNEIFGQRVKNEVFSAKTGDAFRFTYYSPFDSVISRECWNGEISEIVIWEE